MGAVDRRLLRSSRAARAHLSLTVALGGATALLVLAQATLLARIVDRLFLHDATLGDLQWELGALAVVVAARALAAWGFELSGSVAASRVMSELRARLVDHVLRARPNALKGERSGELAATAVQGVDALSAYFSRYLPQLALAVLVPLATLSRVATVDLTSAGIMLLTLPLIPVFMILIGRFAESRSAARWRALTMLSGHFLDVVRGLPTLLAHNRAEAQTETLELGGDGYRRETMATLRVAFLSALVLELAAMLATAMVAVVLGVRLVDGGIGFEPALTVLILAPELYLPLRQLGAQYHASRDGTAAAGEIFELIDAPPDVARSDTATAALDVRHATIRFRDVSFAYSGRPAEALDGLDLVLEPGRCVALIGPSGAGKSTIASLLLGLAEPTAGQITVGGRDLRSLDPAEWRKGIGWLPQRPHIFSGTVGENVRLADPDAPDERVRSALEAAGASFVDALPAGLNTSIGEGGIPLSAGETQRIALARALLRDSTLLILDEPTAHLDAENAASVIEATMSASPGRTTLLIVHNPALAQRADAVVYLADGRIALPTAEAAA